MGKNGVNPKGASVFGARTFVLGLLDETEGDMHDIFKAPLCFRAVTEQKCEDR